LTAVVVLFKAEGCRLCDRARVRLHELREELQFELEEIDITGDPELEARYRESIPVIEVNGQPAFTYYVQPEPFRRKLAGL
jgi:glutaredoxin